MNQAKKTWFNFLFLAVTLFVNALGAMGFINGLSQKQVSDFYPTLITPGPFAFSIWGVIYLLLVACVIVIMRKKDEPYYQKAIDQTTILFWLSCLFNIAWIVSFSYVLIEVSVLFILGLLLSLVFICQRLVAIRENKRWLLPTTFGLYAGWLLIATVVNISTALVKLDWDRFGISEQVWGVVVLTFAVLLVIVIMLRNKNAAFPLPVAWAYFAIYWSLKSPKGYGGEFPMLQMVALVGMAVLIVIAAIRFCRNRYAVLPS